jgi:serine/threonine-protein kinase
MLTGDVPFKGENQVAVAMKHVRDELPDVQVRRPEVSSALAAVVDRATAKDLTVRYATDAELIADLEDVLAIETSRSGEATGQVTAVIRTLPEAKRRRIPGRVLHPARVFVLLGVVAVLLAAGLYLARHHAERGTGSSGTRAGGKPPVGSTAVSLPQDGAKDYDPLGDQREHPGDAKAVLDGIPSTTWSTESYQGGTLGKAGVGIYVDARPSAAATRIELRTPTPGFRATLYGAKSGPPRTLPDPGWVPIGDIASATKITKVSLDGTRYRYFLVWIQALPPGRSNAAISEIVLYQPKGT